jgi:hypothetical protein
MPGPPVTIGCAVTVTPGAAGPPDSGTIVGITQTLVTAGGIPLATTGTICTMVNSVSGVPYPLVIGPSQGLKIAGMGLVRVGDTIPSPPGMLLVIGPPAATYVNDLTA